jgi:hypothetical protein
MVLQFKFQNGLNAKLHDIRKPQSQKVFNLCLFNLSNIDMYDGRGHCIVEVEIDKETVWLVPYQVNKKAAIHELKTAVKPLPKEGLARKLGQRES